MPNTVIQLKKSATPSSRPSDLANGELAINFADGKLFYKNTAGFIAEFSGAVNSFGTVNANGTLVVSDTSGDVLTLLAGNNITIVGDAVNDRVTIGLTNDVVVPGALYVTAAGGDEGGQIELANAITNSTLAGNVVIDIYQNRLRFYEKGSPNKGAFIDLGIATSGVGSNLLATSAGTTDSTARATAEAAFAKANAALPNTNGVTFAGTLTITANLNVDKVISSNNGQGENFRVGDDAWIGDFNIANAVRIKGIQNDTQGYINFGTSDGTLLGRSGTGPLTYGGSTVWHAGNDGAASGLDADLLDGQHGSFYAAATTLDGANTAVGTGANAFATAAAAGANAFMISVQNGSNTAVGTGANTYLLTTLAGANTAVGTGANTYLLATLAGANTAVGTGANTYLLAVIAGANTAVGTGANTYLLTTLAGANTAVGTGANSYAATVGTGANNYLLAVIAGANTAVGTGANTYLLTTLAGANTAVGAGANAYAATVGTGANNYLLAVIAGANTAVGGGANAYATAATAGANAFMIAVQNGSNTAIGAGANTVGSAAFTQANTAQTVAVAAFAKANTSSGGAYFQGNNGDVGSATGLGDIFRVHTNILNANVTIVSGNNALAAGPITINTGRTLIIQSNARVSIV